MSEQIFSKDFKQLVISALIQDKKFLQTAASTLRPEHFEERIHQCAVEIIFQTYAKTKEPPSRTGILTELINALAKSYRVKTDDQQVSMAVKPAEAFVDLIYKPIHGSIADVKEKFLEYVKVQDLKAATLEAYLGLENGSMSWTEAAELVRRTEKMANSRQDIKGVKVFGVADQIKAQFQESKKVRLTTGFQSIDTAMYGGPAKGTLTTFVSEAKGGKSMTLLQTAEANVRKGKKVLVITLELSEEEWRLRFLCKVTGFKYDEVPIRLDEANTKLEHYQKTYQGDILITRFDAYTNCNDYRSYIYSLQQQNFRPDVLVLDYGDLMRSCSRKTSDPDHMHQDAAFVEFRNMLNEFDMAGFTASQSNRDAMERESVRMKDIAGSIGKARHSDHIITWAQSPAQKDLHQGIMAFVGTREGKSGKAYRVRTDYERCSMVESKFGSNIEVDFNTKPQGPKWED